ncbi:MAG: hypothetical protein ACYTBP_10330 [Planctomycetota bacterium]|jgi:hypothetical protein
MSTAVETLEDQLDSLDATVRKDAIIELKRLADLGEIEFAQNTGSTNVHFHSFYSYNAAGFSPSKIAWLAKKAGLAVSGLVDFDVFDGLEEFYEAADFIEHKACAGMESRVYVPEFRDKVLSSPGEPGVTYHVGIGFPSANLVGELDKFQRGLQQTAQQRNKDLIKRVNGYLAPAELDYEKDVCPLTPCGNATERHITLAYARKANSVFADRMDLLNFWNEKLSVDLADSDLPQGLRLLEEIRAKTMKVGGVGYVKPDAGSFPTMEETNHFILSAGGIPTLAWLDGTSDGEREIDQLLETAMASGVAAVNIIPDRNYTPGLGIKDEKCCNLYAFVDYAEKLHLPIIAGTEMNKANQKFVDDFDSAELKPLKKIFLRGAHIVYAHTVLQRQCGIGYTSQWAENNFETVNVKNSFFEEFGASFVPSKTRLIADIDDNIIPQKLLEKISN